MTKKEGAVFPGDKLAITEEFLPGPMTYEKEGKIRALRVGSLQKDGQKMEISVSPSVERASIKIDDWVTGQVEGGNASSATVKLYYHNGNPTYKDFAGMLTLRGLGGGRERGARRGTPVKQGDIVRCRVFSLTNNIIHLTIDEPDMGVVAAQCSNCGKQLSRGNESRAKCVECGNVEERKLAADFGNAPIQP
ncbi:MAG: exosome complex RNA-binding protein Csl4 [archaeon]|nr:MAG: exosome complex RNA-binding protein Csl4 [archaeon]